VLSVLACVGIQIGLQNVFEIIVGVLTLPFVGIALSTLIASAVQGAITGAGTLAILGKQNGSQQKAPRARDWLTTILGGAVTGAILAGAIGLAVGGAGGGGPPEGFWDSVLLFAGAILFFVAVGPIIFAVINGGLRASGLSVAAEFTEEMGESLGEKYVNNLLGRKWAGRSKQVPDGSDVLIRGVVSGILSGSAIFYLEAFGGSDHGFLWKVFVELFGSAAAFIGAGLIMALISAVLGEFKDYFEAEFFKAVILLGKIILVIILILIVANIVFSR
jgi:hypothetical protein